MARQLGDRSWLKRRSAALLLLGLSTPALAQLSVPACFTAADHYCTDAQLPPLSPTQLQAVLDGSDNHLFDVYVAARQLQAIGGDDACLAYVLYQDLAQSHFADAASRRDALATLTRQCQGRVQQVPPDGSGGNSGSAGGESPNEGGGGVSGNSPGTAPGSSIRVWDDLGPLLPPTLVAPDGAGCDVGREAVGRNLPLAALASALAYAVYDDPDRRQRQAQDIAGLKALLDDARGYQPADTSIEASYIRMVLPLHLQHQIEAAQAKLEVLQGIADYRKAVFAAYGLAPALQSTTLFPDDASGFYAEAMAFRGAVLVVYRGTDDPLDWVANLMQFFSLGAKASDGLAATPAQYQRAVAFAQKVKQAYPGMRVYAIGHSLGGGLAAYAALRAGLDGAYTFNPAELGTASLQRLAAAIRAGGASRVFNFIALHPAIGPDLVSSASRLAKGVASHGVQARLVGYRVYVPIRIPNPFAHSALDAQVDAVEKVEAGLWKLSSALGQGLRRDKLRKKALEWVALEEVKYGLYRGLAGGPVLGARSDLQVQEDEDLAADAKTVMKGGMAVWKARQHPLRSALLLGVGWGAQQAGGIALGNVIYDELSIHSAAGLTAGMLPYLDGGTQSWACGAAPTAVTAAALRVAPRLGLRCRLAGHGHVIGLRYGALFGRLALRQVAVEPVDVGEVAAQCEALYRSITE